VPGALALPGHDPKFGDRGLMPVFDLAQDRFEIFAGRQPAFSCMYSNEHIRANSKVLNTMPQPTKDQIFINYSKKDRDWLEKLQIVLKPLIRKGTISIWDDTQIQIGDQWRNQIAEARDLEGGLLDIIA
jgi:hypothetical protein